MKSAWLLPSFAMLPLRSHPLPQGPAPKATLGEVVPDHTFRDFLAGGDGRQNLREFRGEPVLLVNWTDSDFGRGAAQEVEKAAKELAPEGLVTVLIDTHGKSALEIESAVMRLYPGSPARLAVNQKLPIEYLDNGPPPDIALVGVDGTLLFAGSYTVDLNKALKRVRSELERRKEGWGTDDAARMARSLAFGKGNLAAARSTIEAALRSDPAHAERIAVQGELSASFDSRLRSVQFFLEQGQPLRSLDEARALLAAVAGIVDWEARAGALLQELEGAEVARELELDEKLSALLQPLAKRAPEREAERLRKFAAEASGTRVGKRALHLAEVAALAAGK